MNWACDHMRAKMNAEQANHHDPKTIAQNSKRNDKSDEDKSTPPTLEEEMRRHQARDEKDETGSDAAAFLSHLDCHTRQLKDHPLSQNWRARKCEEEIRGIR